MTKVLSQMSLLIHCSGPDPNEVARAKELCEDLLNNVREQYQRFKENPPQQRGYGSSGYGQGDRQGYGAYGGYGAGYGGAQTPGYGSAQSPTAQAPPGTPGAPGAPGAGSPTTADYGQDPYAAYGGYANYVAWYTYYAQQQQQQAAPGAAGGPPGPPNDPPPPPPPSGSPPAANGGYNAVRISLIVYRFVYSTLTSPGTTSTWYLTGMPCDLAWRYCSPSH